MNKHIISLVLAAALLASCAKDKGSYKMEPLKVVTETVSAGRQAATRHYVGKVEEESSTPVSFTSKKGSM